MPFCLRTDPPFSATSALSYFAKQLLGSCSVASCSSRELRLDRWAASSGLSSPGGLFLVSALVERGWGVTLWLRQVSQQNSYLMQAMRKAMYGKHKCSWSKRIFSWKKFVEIFLMEYPLWSPRQTMGLGCLLSCKNQLDQGQACPYGPSEEVVSSPVFATAFPWCGCKHHTLFCTLVLICKWKSLEVFERLLLLAGTVLFLLTSSSCLSSALIFAFGSTTWKSVLQQMLIPDSVL